MRSYKLKNKIITFLSGVSLLSSLVVTGIFSLNKDIIPNSGDSQPPLSITISQEQKDEIFNVNTDQNHSNITFKQNNFRSEDGYVTILKGKEDENISSLENSDYIHYMKSITVISENSNDVLGIEFDFDLNNQTQVLGNTFYYNDLIMSGETYIFGHSNPDCFRLVNRNTEDIKIKSIVIEFYCEGLGFARPDASLYNYIYYESSNEYAITGCKASNLPSSLIIPSEYDGDRGKHPICQVLYYAFEHYNDFQYLVIPSSVNVDSGGFFTNKPNLKSLLISYGNYSFSPIALESCSGIEEYSLLSKGTAPLKREYFPNGNIKKIKFVSNNSTISADTFLNQTSLEEVIIGGYVAINDSAFQNCTSLRQVGLYNGSFSLGANSFAGNYNLLTLPKLDNVTSIGDNAFDSCSKISSFIPSSTLLSLGENCFNKCSNLITVDLRNTPITFTSNFLGEVENLKDFYYNKNVSSINPSLFKSANKIENVYLDSLKYSEWSYSSYSFMLENDLHASNNASILRNFSSYNNSFIKLGCSFEYEAFSVDENGYINGINYDKCTDLDTLVLPFCYKNNESTINPIKGIKEKVFEKSQKLKNVIIQVLDTAVRYDIQSLSFYYSSVENVIIDVINLNNIEDFTLNLSVNSFDSCEKLLSFTTNAKTNIIGDECFLKCKSLTSFNGNENSISSVGGRSFYECTSLKIFSSKISEVGNYGFFNTRLTSIPFLADSFTYFGSYSFGNCTSLADSIDFSNFNNNLEIKSYAFSNSSCKYIRFNPNSSQIILNKFALEISEGNYFEKVYFGYSVTTFYIYSNNTCIGDFTFDTDAREETSTNGYIYFPINAFAMKALLSHYDKISLKIIANTIYDNNAQWCLLGLEGPFNTTVDLFKEYYPNECGNINEINDGKVTFYLTVSDEDENQLNAKDLTSDHLEVIYTHPGGERAFNVVKPFDLYYFSTVEKNASNSFISILYTYKIDPALVE